MSKNIINLEDLDVKTETQFMKWLKRIAYIVTIMATLSGGILGIFSFVREVRDPKAQAGYEEHSKVLDTCIKDVRENREEIRYLYHTLLNIKNNSSEHPSNFENRARSLPEVPEQEIKKWDKLQQRKIE